MEPPDRDSGVWPGGFVVPMLVLGVLSAMVSAAGLVFGVNWFAIAASVITSVNALAMVAVQWGLRRRRRNRKRPPKGTP